MLAGLVKKSLTGPTSDGRRKWREVTKGMAEYRDGQFESAVGWLRSSLAKNPNDLHPHVTAHAFLAMALHRSGQPGDAQQSLDSARQIFEERFPKIAHGDLGGKWSDWLYCRAAFREAKELLDGDSEPPTPAGSHPAPTTTSGRPAPRETAP